jgi:anhydro-N-acetylmuramic acid kinase
MKFSENIYINWLSKPRVVCGIMTGTSLDGIDTAIAEFFIDRAGRHHFNLLAYNTTDFPSEIKEFIIKIIYEKNSIADISGLNFLLSQIYATSVMDLCKSKNIKLSEIDAIGMHGQTVWHEPKGKDFSNYQTNSTLQLGSVSALANLLGITVVGDFRSADIAVGGSGAPLVPVFDYEFLRDETQDTICLNIGGIANITLLPAGCNYNEIIAIDTGPGNVLIDNFMQFFYNLDYDKNGETARKGKIIEKLSFELMSEPFIKAHPPKSTGRELFNKAYIFSLLYKLNLSNVTPENLIRTLTQFTVLSIAENIKQFGNPSSKIITSGGGCNNKYLMELLSSELPKSNIITTDALGIPSDAKEAICFAYLGWRTLGGMYSNIPSVTGAKRPAILGTIAFPE